MKRDMTMRRTATRSAEARRARHAAYMRWRRAPMALLNATRALLRPRRTYRFHIRLAPAEVEALRLAARAAGFKRVATFARGALLAAIGAGHKTPL